jgi:hypothetical protein
VHEARRRRVFVVTKNRRSALVRNRKLTFMRKPLDREALKAACFDVARTTMWDRRPIDVASIDAVAGSCFSIALDYLDFVQGQSRDPNLVTRAVMYLSRIHAIPPMRSDTTWFSDMLAVLIELACPNAQGAAESESFYRDIEEGIAVSRGQFDSSAPP